MGGRLSVLGVIRVDDERGERQLNGSQPRMLLVRAVLEHGRPLSAEELADTLWPDGVARHWEGALRGVVTKVRVFLPHGAALENVGHSYRFTCAGVGIDVWDAERALSEAESSLAEGDAPTAAAAAEEAVLLLEPPLLPGIDAEWLAGWRTRFDAGRGRARLVAAAALTQLGRHDDAVRHATAAVADDPYDEESHRMLMAAHLAAGNRAAALRAYGSCRRRLADELGVAPSAETERAYLGLLAPDWEGDALGGGDPEGTRHLLPSDRHPFVGRERELAVLASAWDDARAGRRRVILAHGEAGVGKTRLALEAVRRCRPVNVLYGRSSPEQVVPYEPFAAAIGRHLGRLDDDEVGALLGPFGREIATLVPEIVGRSEPSLATLEGDNRPRLFEAVRYVLAKIAAAPTVLVLDDLQWIDPASLVLARHLLERLDGAPLLVLATYRDDLRLPAGLSGAVGELHRIEGCHPLAVPGLDPDDVVDLLRRHGIDAPDELGALLHARTGGNGFYLTQIVAATKDAGGRLDPWLVPATVHELVRHQVGTLAPAERSVLEIASCIGTTVPVGLLEGAASLGGWGVESIDELVDRGLLLETTEGDYGFSHAIVQEVVHHQMTRARRRRLHLQVAATIEQRWPGDPEWSASLSGHYLVTDDPDHLPDLIDASIRGGRRAMERHAYEQAAELYDRAAVVLAAAPWAGAERLASVLLDLGAARRRAGDFAAALEALTRALELARAHGERTVFAETVLELVAKGGRGVAVELADPERADLLQEALDLLGDSDPQLAVSLHAELALSLLFTDQHERLRASARRADQLARAGGTVDLAVRAAVARRLLQPLPEAASRRLTDLDALVVEPRTRVSLEQQVRLRMWRLTDAFELGDRPLVERELHALTTLADELHQPYWLWVAGSWKALHLFLAGDAERAEHLASVNLELVAGLHHPETLLAYGVQIVGFRLALGRGGEVESMMDDVVAALPTVPAMRAGLAYAQAQGGKHEAAARNLARLSVDDFSGIPLDGSWSAAIACLAGTAVELGDRAAATALIPLLEPHRERFVVVSGFGGGGGCWGPVTGMLAMLRYCAGDDDGAERDRADALAALDRFGAPLLRDRLLRALPPPRVRATSGSPDRRP